jgi:hypothetical protein
MKTLAALAQALDSPGLLLLAQHVDALGGHIPRRGSIAEGLMSDPTVLLDYGIYPQLALGRQLPAEVLRVAFDVLASGAMRKQVSQEQNVLLEAAYQRLLRGVPGDVKTVTYGLSFQGDRAVDYISDFL